MHLPEPSTETIGFAPAPGDRILIAGDELDLPMVRAALASLPPKSRGQVFIEVGGEAEVEPLEAPSRFSVCWLYRDRGQSLRRSVEAWLSEMLPVSGVTDHRVYAWVSQDGAARVLTN